MLKRIVAGVLTAVVFPLFYLLFIGHNDILTRSDSITDELGYSYTLLYDIDDMAIVKSDNVGEILGKWKARRSNGCF